MIGKFVVITGLDGSGTTSLAEALCKQDPNGILFKTPCGPFNEVRKLFDDKDVKNVSSSAHYLYYLASVAYASEQIKNLLINHNVYCVRYLIDTVVSHRVAGLDVDLSYEGMGYSIHKPDITIFISIDESTRQSRITARGKSSLDKLLDNDDIRNRFIVEFNRYAYQFHAIDNNSNMIQNTVAQAKFLLNWLS